MACDENKYTLTYDEDVKGWTSFHSFFPDWIIGMNNKAYVFKDGELYIQHSDNVERNTFFGVQYPSEISLIMNENPLDTKVFKNLKLNGNNSWNALIRAFMSDEEDTTFSTITDVEFVEKEGNWFAYTRRSEDTTDFSSKSTYGIGTVQNVVGTVITVSTNNSLITVGDELVRDDLLTVGNIVSVSDGEITVDAVANNPNGMFIIGSKNSRIEGSELRGYAAKVELDITTNDKVELFSVSSEVFKSFS